MTVYCHLTVMIVSIQQIVVSVDRAWPLIVQIWGVIV